MVQFKLARLAASSMLLITYPKVFLLSCQPTLVQMVEYPRMELHELRKQITSGLHSIN